MNKPGRGGVYLFVRNRSFNPIPSTMKKLLLVTLAIVSLGALVPDASARGHRRDHGYHHSRSRHVYLIERGRPVYRRAYFDDYDRCYTYSGPRRVYVSSYYDEYPRYYHPRPVFHPPAVSFSFGFRD